MPNGIARISRASTTVHVRACGLQLHNNLQCLSACRIGLRGASITSPWNFTLYHARLRQLNARARVCVCVCVYVRACTIMDEKRPGIDYKWKAIPHPGRRVPCRAVALVQIAVESLSTLAADNARARWVHSNHHRSRPWRRRRRRPRRGHRDPVGERLTCGRAVVAAAIVEHDPDTMFFLRSIASALARFCAQLLVVQARGHYGQCLDAGYGAAAAAVCCHGHQHRIAPLEVNGQRWVEKRGVCERANIHKKRHRLCRMFDTVFLFVCSYLRMCVFSWARIIAD